MPSFLMVNINNLYYIELLGTYYQSITNFLMKKSLKKFFYQLFCYNFTLDIINKI